MKRSVNGRPVPTDLTAAELIDLLSSPDMMDFAVACEALSAIHTEEACDAMGEYLFNKDIYRRLYVLKLIFENPYAVKYVRELERAVNSDNILFASAGLGVYKKTQLVLPDDVIISAVDRHFARLGPEIGTLSRLETTDDNYRVILRLFAKSDSGSKNEIIARVLCEKYLPEKAAELFAVFSDHADPKIRVLAVRIGVSYGFDISKFAEDGNGHVRQAAEKALNG